MSMLQQGARVGAAAVIVGFSLAGPQALGIACADNPDQDSTSVSAGPAKSGAASTARSARPAHGKTATPPAPAGATDVSGVAAGATTAASARSATSAVAARTVLGQSQPTTGHSRRQPSTPGTEASASAVVAGGSVDDSSSVAASASSAPADAATVVTTTAMVAPTGDHSAPTAAVAAPADNIAALSVPRAGATTSSATDIFSGLINSISGFFEGVGLLVRRTFFNQAPTVNPVQTTGQTEGPITGSINAVDPENDPMTYSLTAAPRYGTVTIDNNGNYTYTPTPGGGFNGADAFTVAATDTGSHINLLDPFRSASTDALVSVTQNLTAIRVAFDFIYGSGSQYWSSAARAALQSTAIYLSSYFVVAAPVTVTYSVTGRYSLLSGTLASAGSDLVSTAPGFYDTVVQQKILTGVDANGSAPDGQIDWNFGYPWALTDPVTSNQYDFQSTAMHELVHTFGFISVIDSAGNNTGTNWTTFDSFVVTSNATHPISSNFTWLSAYNPNLTGGGGGLYFGGPNAEAAYGGQPVPLYTPSPWQAGSSMSHLNDATFTGSNTQLMNATHGTGPGVRTLSAVEIGILKDLGYNVVSPSQNLALFVIGLVFIRRRKRD